jgi:hypothetical protein
MRTKTSDRHLGPERAGPGSPVEPAFPDTWAYWLEDESGQQISRRYAASGGPLRLAGRALENTGSLTGYTLVRRSLDSARHVIASDRELEVMATPFMPKRTPEEAARFQRFRRALHETFGPPRRPDVIRDKRVY